MPAEAGIQACENTLLCSRNVLSVEARLPYQGLGQILTTGIDAGKVVL
jgi:hypothetical protein